MWLEPPIVAHGPPDYCNLLFLWSLSSSLVLDIQNGLTGDWRGFHLSLYFTLNIFLNCLPFKRCKQVINDKINFFKRKCFSNLFCFSSLSFVSNFHLSLYTNHTKPHMNMTQIKMNTFLVCVCFTMGLDVGGEGSIIRLNTILKRHSFPV